MATAAAEELVKLPVGVEVVTPAAEARNPDPAWTASPVVLVLLLTLVLVSFVRCIFIKHLITALIWN
jgi:hypothetical protein